MTIMNNILFTGGSGRLGQALKRLGADFQFPTRDECDIANLAQLNGFIERTKPSCVVHAAAYTKVEGSERDASIAIETNIIGTANIASICAKKGIRLIYISTDYVFSGERGMYTEDDPVSPINTYAWSKLGGECSVRLVKKSLIIRTSFSEDVFPHEKAFSDQWTSREPVGTFAKKLLDLVKRSDIAGILHVGGPRRTVLEYAQSLDPRKAYIPISRESITTVRIPRDTSLDTTRYNKLIS